MVITGKSKLDKQQFGWIYFINHFREQFKKMPKELSFTDEEIPFLCFCYANGWIKTDFPEYKNGEYIIQHYAFNYNKINTFFSK